MGVSFRDRFEADRVPQAWREELAERGLPLPSWDRAEHVWWWPDGPETAAAVAFVAEAHDEVLDDEAEARVAALAPSGDRRARLLGAEARLRPYQRTGVAFLRDKHRAFLADGMGLGKSVQALLALEHLQAHPAIVVCPASVKLSWKAEVLKWVPWRSVQVLQTGRDVIEDPDVVIVNPELLPSLIEDLVLSGPRAVVLDEAHYFKNPGAQRSELAQELMEDVGIRFALTGTPIPNRRPDLIQQLRLIGQLEEVLHIYRGVLPHWWTREQGPLRHDHAMKALERLPRKEINERLRATCFLRRTKDEVTDELPPFHRTRRDVTLEERSGYRREEESFVDWVRRLRRDFPEGWGAPQRMQGRQHLGRLRREAALAKIPAVVEWASGLDDERVVYFAHHKQVVHELAKALDEALGARGPRGRKTRRAPAAASDSKPATSGAVGADEAAGVVDAGEAAPAAGADEAAGVVGAGEAADAAAARDGLAARRHAVITGDVPAPRRQQMIDSLHQYAGIVATMDASGQGVDGMQLHARHVVFIELDWTPTKHEQCEGRLHRIGQKDRVEAWYFTAHDTIDAAMMKRLDEKWRDVQGILGGEEDESVDRFIGDVMDRAARGVVGAGLWR